VECCYQQKTCYISETGQDTTKVTIDDQYEVAYALSIGAKNQRPWMTLNGYYALCFKIHAFSEPTTKI